MLYGLTLTRCVKRLTGILDSVRKIVWNIPEEWEIFDSYLEHIQTGKKFALFKESNLNVVGYSMPINKILDKKDILKRIHTLPEQPNYVPYVTSYYKGLKHLA